MFSLVSGVYDAYLAPTQLNLLVVGASGVGKTALLERLKVTQFTKNQTAALPVQQQLAQEQVPEVFLPLALREKQKEFHDSFRSSTHSSEPANRNNNNNNNKSKHKPTKKKKKPSVPAAAAPPEAPKRRSFLSCPAPSKYTQAHADSSSSSSSEGDDSDDEYPASHRRLPLESEVSQDLSLEDVNLNNSLRITRPTTPILNNSSSNGETMPEEDDDDDDNDEDDDQHQQQHDLKDKTKPMLPLHKIRPTSTYQ